MILSPVAPPHVATPRAPLHVAPLLEAETGGGCGVTAVRRPNATEPAIVRGAVMAARGQITIDASDGIPQAAARR